MPGSRPDSTEERPSLEVRLGPATRRQYDILPDQDRVVVRRAMVALLKLTDRGGKTLKPIRGTEGAFHRARVGDWRIMYDVLSDENVLLVLGIVRQSW